MEIKGLTRRQKQMLDIMWSLDTKEELYSWIDSLKSQKDQRTAHVLLKMVLLEGVDEYVADMSEYPEAREVLLKIMMK